MKPQLKLVQLGADGDTESPLETWTIKNPLITSVDFGDLDYSQEGMLNISVNISYDWATCEGGIANATDTWTLNERFSGDDTGSTE